VPVEALGLKLLRTRQEHWKPTTDAVQRFGTEAGQNVFVLDDDEAKRFVAGEDQEVDWEGDWGYLSVAHELAGGVEPIGVGLFTYGELKSMVPKGHQRDL
jgi:NOL1/NOP2/fmu family ribosome biogenesis protein